MRRRKKSTVNLFFTVETAARCGAFILEGLHSHAEAFLVNSVRVTVVVAEHHIPPPQVVGGEKPLLHVNSVYSGAGPRVHRRLQEEQPPAA